MRRALEPALDDSPHLLELLHQPDLRVEPAGSVDDRDVPAPGQRRFDGIEGDGGRIAAAGRPDVVRTGPLSPDLQLLTGGRAKRVRRGDDDVALVFPQAKGELADGRRLARAVDADHEHDARSVVDGQRPRLAEQPLDLLRERRVELAEFAPPAQPLDEHVRGSHAHVGADQRLLEVLPRLVVEGIEAGQPLPDAAAASAKRAA